MTFTEELTIKAMVSTNKYLSYVLYPYIGSLR